MKIHSLIAVCFLAILALAGCDSGSPYGGTQDPTQVKIGKPYSISGITYEPKYEPNYVEEGIASWYGPDFHERMTASGEQYDQHEMTAAHKTLPMPSIVRVTRLDTGQTVDVRINDRGPFVAGRIIDLSKAAAEKIGLDKSGLAKVRVEYLGQDSDQYIASKGLKAPWWGEVQYATAAPSPEVTMTSSETVMSSAPEPLIASDLPPPPQETMAQPMMAPAPAPAIAAASNNIAPAAMSAPAETLEPQPEIAAPADSNLPAPVATASLSTAPAAITQPNSLSVGYIAPAPTPSGKTAYRIQTGAFTNYQNAERNADSLSELASPEIRETVVSGRTFYRVSLGPVYDAEAAQLILTKVKEQGHSDARMVVE